jgi:hypothetical protein
MLLFNWRKNLYYIFRISCLWNHFNITSIVARFFFSFVKWGFLVQNSACWLWKRSIVHGIGRFIILAFQLGCSARVFLFNRCSIETYRSVLWCWMKLRVFQYRAKVAEKCTRNLLVKQCFVIFGIQIVTLMVLNYYIAKGFSFFLLCGWVFMRRTTGAAVVDRASRNLNIKQYFNKFN